MHFTLIKYHKIAIAFATTLVYMQIRGIKLNMISLQYVTCQKFPGRYKLEKFSVWEGKFCCSLFLDHNHKYNYYIKHFFKSCLSFLLFHIS